MTPRNECDRSNSTNVFLESLLASTIARRKFDAQPWKQIGSGFSRPAITIASTPYLSSLPLVRSTLREPDSSLLLQSVAFLIGPFEPPPNHSSMLSNSPRVRDHTPIPFEPPLVSELNLAKAKNDLQTDKVCLLMRQVTVSDLCPPLWKT